MRIGIDLMGSDSPPQTLFNAVLQVANQFEKTASFVVYLTQPVAQELLSKKLLETELVEGAARVDLNVVSEFIAMDDEPLSAIRLKKNSSLVSGIRQLDEHQIDAFVSAGNTGALIACASIILPRFLGIERPPLLALLPTQKKPLAMVDVGGTISCTANQLVKYAHLGAAYQKCCFGIKIPTVGMLNIGVESKKGTAVRREAYQLLQRESEQPDPLINFLGNMEAGGEAFQGNIDVLITDGFTGNVMLKTSEGISSFIFAYLQKKWQEAMTPDMHAAFDEMQRHFRYDEYPGAIVCGVDGIVMKCHGAATRQAMTQSIIGAINLVENGLLEKIKQELSQRFSES